MAQAAAEPDDRTLAVTKRSQAADGVVALTLARPDGGRLPDWTPGAHIDMVLPDGMIRQYSLCGDRWDAHAYRIAVRREPDGPDGPGASGWIHDRLRAGDLVGMGGPRNNFPLVPAGRYLFIAGGIGITPLLPMVAQASMLGADWTLLYAGRTRASMAFVDELSGHDERSVLDEQSGRDDAIRPGEPGAGVRRGRGQRLDLGAWLGEPHQDVAVYCCGPDRLLAEVRARCAAWPRHALRTERFTPVAAPAAAGGGPFEVELARTGATVSVQPGMSVLDAALGAGVSVLSSCRRGLCGTCEVTVLDGPPRPPRLAARRRRTGRRRLHVHLRVPVGPRPAGPRPVTTRPFPEISMTTRRPVRPVRRDSRQRRRPVQRGEPRAIPPRCTPRCGTPDRSSTCPGTTCTRSPDTSRCTRRWSTGSSSSPGTASGLSNFKYEKPWRPPSVAARG